MPPCRHADGLAHGDRFVVDAAQVTLAVDRDDVDMTGLVGLAVDVAGLGGFGDDAAPGLLASK